ncbi:MAG TPA: DNA polymerase III subunit delta' [Brevundimonas sp.]|uniref:DNA polymerase III subunit delta' n=1 Tax=Brevundimonas sp. TaxID=1871086 RepID=UPI002DEB400F|nr:DNA polymerase III subunit delta' [Brevundimonas sp.]
MTKHPRDRFDLTPDVEAEVAFLDALDRGRLHHAWLLCGPEGRGKATFAHRAARRLLGAAPDPSRGPLGARRDDPVSRLISAQSHPDLLVLERVVEGGRTKRNISVDQARELPEFFSKSPAQAGRRVAIIDAADDLNANAANAILKTLEEPPASGVLLLVCHAPGRLLPTIRSRCRRLVFKPWTETAIAELLRNGVGLDRGEAQAVAASAGGSPGAALAAVGDEARAGGELARRWVEGAGPLDRSERLALQGTLRGQEGAARFEDIMHHLATAVRDRALAGGHGASDWADLWTRLTDLPGRAAGLNLDRGEVLASALNDLERIKARAC